MSPENEWFKSEKLKVYYFIFEVVALVPILVGGVLAYTGILFEIGTWAVAIAGIVVLVAFGFLTWWTSAFFWTADYRLTLTSYSLSVASAPAEATKKQRRTENVIEFLYPRFAVCGE